MRKVLSYLFVVVVLAFAGGVAFLFLSPDYEPIVVRSESMKPTLMMGDVALIGPLRGEVEPGMIICYRHDGQLVTHRVHSIEGGGIITTKGDALADPDPWIVIPEEIEGVCFLRIPYLGYLSAFVRTPVGWGILIIVPALALIGYFIRDIFKETKRQGGDTKERG
ncbi:MAG: signal peptidase I [Deltaproteobacteria bacterium]|nr:signal peptidase I [Deltaproteobacteria bacterium]